MANSPNTEAPASAAAQNPQSLLAHSFPAWDLLPAHPVLLRRKSAPVRPTIPLSVAAAPATQIEAKDPATRACKQCGEAVDAGSNFCTECGTRFD